MQCINPLKAGFDKAGNITFSSKASDKSLESFAFECRKCLPCRLNIAREKAIRSMHEAKMHPENIFLTLTYDEEHLKSPRLNYDDFQKFMKRLRFKNSEKKITYIVTGEYGDKNKRPHWHALVFNYRPSDSKHLYTSERGDEVFSSKELGEIWGKGRCEYGSLTLDSANYVARYAAKKLTHGKDDEHDYHPIHRISSRRGIGRTWIERYWKHTFRNGFIVLNGTKMRIPRYYTDWLKQHKPDEWRRYVTEVRPKIQELAQLAADKELQIYIENRNESPHALPRSKIHETILKSKFKRLQEYLKL